MPFRFRHLACATTVALSFQVHAQQVSPPDAGQSLRELEQRRPALPPKQSLDLVLPDAADAGATAGGPSVQVGDFRIEGNSAIASAELLPLLAGYKGHTLTLGELQAAAHRITLRYRERGYPLARAYVPAQEIDAGVVTIQVLEGRYGNVRIDNHARIVDGAVAELLDGLQPGDAVRAVPLESALLSLRDLAGVQARSTLLPGASTGASDLLVDVQPGPLFSGSLAADDYGNRYTGQYRLGANLDINSPLRLGDRFSLNALGSDQDQHYYRAAWQVPFGPYATRLGASWSRMDYELGKDFKSLDAHGKAVIASAFVSQPLLRSRRASLYVALQVERKRLLDDIDLYDERDRKRSQLWTASLYGDGRDAWLGGGESSFSLSWGHGRLRMDGGADLPDQVSGIAGDFDVVRSSVVRLQRLGARLGLYGQVQGQWAGGNLDSSEKFYLGGAYGVRAYPQGEASGDQGWLGNLELRYALAAAWQLSAFVDHGQVRLNKDPWDSSDNHRRLSGTGVGADWVAHGWRVGASLAWKLGSAPVESGGDRSPRVWAKISRDF